MSDKYQSRHLQSMFDISSETVRNWAKEFEVYLSPSANPPKGKYRKFTEEDLRVIALIARMKDDGAIFEGIHEALQDGARAEPPAVPDELLDIASSPAGLQMINMLQDLTRRVAELENSEQKQLKSEIIRLRESRDGLLKEIGRLEARLEIAKEDKED